MKVLAYTASPRKTPESKRDNGFIVPGTGDAEGEFPSAWYSGLDKESLHEFLRQKVDLLVLAVPLTYVSPSPLFSVSKTESTSVSLEYSAVEYKLHSVSEWRCQYRGAPQLFAIDIDIQHHPSHT